MPPFGSGSPWSQRIRSPEKGLPTNLSPKSDLLVSAWDEHILGRHLCRQAQRDVACRRETILEAHLSNGHAPNGSEQPGQTAAEAAAAEAASLQAAPARDVESLASSLYLDLRPFMDQAPPSVRWPLNPKP